MKKKHIPSSGGFRWRGVPVHDYKAEGDHFRDITRQVLFEDPEGIGCELRYFEVLRGGHSTLEKHEHVHLVVIVRGSGLAVVGDEVLGVATHDVVHVPPQTWHQFLASENEPLGFLCLVRCDRDRPARPTEEELDSLRRHPVVGPVIRA